MTETDDDKPLDPVLLMVDSALAAPRGREIVADATSHLWDLAGTNRFNSERAKEVFTIAIDNAVWAYLKNMPIRSFMYRDYKASGLGPQHALRLTNEFTRNGALIPDQRPVRKHFRWLIGA